MSSYSLVNGGHSRPSDHEIRWRWSDGQITHWAIVTCDTRWDELYNRDHSLTDSAPERGLTWGTDPHWANAPLCARIAWFIGDHEAKLPRQMILDLVDFASSLHGLRKFSVPHYGESPDGK